VNKRVALRSTSSKTPSSAAARGSTARANRHALSPSRQLLWSTRSTTNALPAVLREAGSTATGRSALAEYPTMLIAGTHGYSVRVLYGTQGTHSTHGTSLGSAGALYSRCQMPCVPGRLAHARSARHPPRSSRAFAECRCCRWACRTSRRSTTSKSSARSAAISTRRGRGGGPVPSGRRF